MIDLPKDLKDYEFSSEGGRSVWYYTHYLLLYTYNVSYPEWPSFWPNPDVIVAGDFRNHAVTWYRIFRGDKALSDYTYLEETIKDSGFLQKIEKYIQVQKENGTRVLKGINPTALSSSELKSLFKHYFDHFQYLLLVAANVRRIDRAIIGVTKDKHGEKADEVLRMSSILTQHSFAMEEELELLDLAACIQGKIVDNDKIESELQRIYNSYAWSVMGYYDEQPKGLDFYRQRLVELVAEDAEKRKREVSSRLEEDKETRKKYVATLDARDQTLADIASYSAYLKDYFKSSINELEYFAEPLFEELGRRTQLTKVQIKDLAPTEILEIAMDPMVKSHQSSERMRHNVILYAFGEMHHLVGKEADEFEHSYLAIQDAGRTEFRGRVACKGKVTGKVAVIKDHSEFGKLKQGEILVVVNTSPDYVPIMQKAGAIVAEEGGLTSHVSVVSREFGIPSIVGIRHITELLKDGDMVEVDAEKGIVRKI